MIKSHVVKYLGAAVEISSVIMKSFGAVSKPLRADAALSNVRVFAYVLYGYSPGPKKRILIPVRTSNSVFAVPAPTDGTLKYPLEYSLNIFLKFGIGSSEKRSHSTSVGSKNDSSCTKIIFGRCSSDLPVELFVSFSSSLIFSIVSLPYPVGSLIPVLNKLAEKQYGNP